MQRHIAFLLFSSGSVFEQLLGDVLLDAFLSLPWVSSFPAGFGRFISAHLRVEAFAGRLGHASREAKVADFDFASRRDENVGWLDITVHNVGHVDETHGHKHIVQESYQMLFAKVYFTF